MADQNQITISDLYGGAQQFGDVKHWQEHLPDLTKNLSHMAIAEEAFAFDEDAIIQQGRGIGTGIQWGRNMEPILSGGSKSDNAIEAEEGATIPLDRDLFLNVEDKSGNQLAIRFRPRKPSNRGCGFAFVQNNNQNFELRIWFYPRR